MPGLPLGSGAATSSMMTSNCNAQQLEMLDHPQQVSTLCMTIPIQDSNCTEDDTRTCMRQVTQMTSLYVLLQKTVSPAWILQASNCLYTVPEWFDPMQQRHQTDQTLLRAYTSCNNRCLLCLTNIMLFRHTKSTDVVKDKALNDACIATSISCNCSA